MRIALGLEYDGAAFTGWQTQPDRRGAQDALESALASVAGAPTATICAGRTDTGVHALDQVVHFDTGAKRPLGAWVRGVNRFLPHSIAVRWAVEVPDVFHARFSAVRRTYDYWIVNDPVRSPLAHARAGWVFRPLDATAMQEAAARLIGRHDFSSFRSSQCQAASPVRDHKRRPFAPEYTATKPASPASAARPTSSAVTVRPSRREPRAAMAEPEASPSMQPGTPQAQGDPAR